MLFADEQEDQDRTLEFIHQLLVVAFYRVIELASIRAATWRWGSKWVEKNGLYKANVLKVVLKSELGLEISRLPGYKAVDELRCINNSFKHRGTVSAALARFPNWKKGALLAYCGAHLERLSGPCGQYLGALAEHLVPR